MADGDPTSWNTETTRDAAGNLVVTVIVAGPQSQIYQQSWVSGTSNIGHSLHTSSIVQDEINTQGPALLAAVKAKTVAPGKTTVARPVRKH